MTIEQHAKDIQRRHNIRSLHIFAQGPNWRVFASRGTEAFQSSVEEGRGADISAALRNLDDRLTAGPINRGALAPLADF